MIARCILFALMGVFLMTDAKAEPAVPQSLVIVGCRVDDLTGQPGRHDPAMAAKDWRDLELKIIDGEYQCKRELVNLEDGSAYSAGATGDMIPLTPNFSRYAQCARAGVALAAPWNEANQGWAVVAIGCPVPIVNINGDGHMAVIAYKMPDCPTYMPGTKNRMKCRFDASLI